MGSFPETYNDQRSQSHHLYLPLLGPWRTWYYRSQGQQAPWTSEVGLPSHNGHQCEADALPVSGEVPGEAPDSSVVPKTNTRSSVYKGEPHKMSKCRKKINLDVANFQPNKRTTQIWMTHHQYGISGLVLWTCHVGQGRETVVASANVGFFISQATSFEICFDQSQTLSVCQRKLTPS